LENLETNFYQAVLQTDIFTGKSLELVKSFAEDEIKHLGALREMLEKQGGKSPEQPLTKFPLENQRETLRLATTLEDVGSAAYLAEVPRIESREILSLILSIHTVEARHAAALSSIFGNSITPQGALAEPLTRPEVEEAVRPFIEKKNDKKEDTPGGEVRQETQRERDR
jgi:rubrerythrin